MRTIDFETFVAAPLLALLAVGSGLLLCSPADAAPPSEELRGPNLFPPDSCRSAACLRGSSAFRRGNYGKAARLLEEGIWSKSSELMGLETYSDMVLLAAVARERRGDHARAAAHFDRLAKLVDAGRDYFAFRALRAVLAADATQPDLLRQLQRRGALSTPYPGVHRLRLEYHRAAKSELPGPELARKSLRNGDRKRVCSWLSEAVSDPAFVGEETEPVEERRAELAQLLYGFCLPPRGEDPYPGQPDSPGDLARFRRAERLYGRVDFKGALEELQKVDFKSLDRETWCRARFRMARTHYRLDHHAKANRRYEEVVSKCDRDDSVDPRIRSLYALGRSAYHDDDYERARERMTAILEDYPERSHADDALLYLGRVARARGNTDRERKLVVRALEEYPGGDMVHEFVWEYLESDFRSGDDRAFVDALDRLELPDVDEQYFSQGRLLYFRALAEANLGLESAARDHLQTVWRRYPFSFYGYLSRLQLRDRGADIPALDGRRARSIPNWYFDSNWRGAGVRRAARLGLPEMAAAMETGRVERSRQSDNSSISGVDWWRLAYLHHRAGNVVESHNIARRKIDGRPWTDPAVGRITRWRVAFPAPFQGRVVRAISAESRQRPDARVSPHLPTAIMREESGFDVDIESWAGAVGLMQLMPTTARHHDDDLEVEADQKTLRKARINVRIGVEHLHLLADHFSNHPVVMVTAYNAGMGAVGGWLPGSDGESIALWVEDVPYRQARNYAKRVMGSYAAYQWLAGLRRLDPRVGSPPPTK